MSTVFVVGNFLRQPDSVAMDRLIAAARASLLAVEDIAELALGLANSGERLPRDVHSADVASTGGPSSLSTLLCPLQLRARGLRVPKLGVPGRPAGGVDVLQTVPGYQAKLKPSDARGALNASGYVHLVADQRWAPLDAKLFAYRQQSSGQALPELVIASILAKKLSMGVVGCGLEVRVAPHGNFGEDTQTSRANALLYKAAAMLLELQPVCALTDAAQPYQPYIGRGEALLALAEVFSGRADPWLADHAALCQRIADAVAKTLSVEIERTVELGALRRAHDELLRTHRSSPEAFDGRVEAIRAIPRAIARAGRTGFVIYDLELMRKLLVARQRDEVPEHDVPDPAGVILLVRPGGRVEAGEPVMSIRTPNGETRLNQALGSCAKIESVADVEASRDRILEFI